MMLYLWVAGRDVYVSDDAAYRALVLARRAGDEEAASSALAHLAQKQPNWLALKATDELPLDIGPDYPFQATETLTADLMAKVSGLETLGRPDLALDELRYAAKVSETPEVIVRLAGALGARGQVQSAYGLALDLLEKREALPLACWRLAYPQPYEESVSRWAERYDLEPDLIWAVMRQESAYAPTATSSAGAMGLMQLMPDTAADASEAAGSAYAPGSAYRIDQAVQLGAAHLSDLLQRYEGDTLLALMAYNAGASSVDAWLAEPTGADEDDLLRFVGYGETREYVERVMLNLEIYRRLYGPPGSEAS
jgi:soluble lytic murein transglycosylase